MSSFRVTSAPPWRVLHVRRAPWSQRHWSALANLPVVDGTSLRRKDLARPCHRSLRHGIDAAHDGRQLLGVDRIEIEALLANEFGEFRILHAGDISGADRRDPLGRYSRSHEG